MPDRSPFLTALLSAAVDAGLDRAAAEELCRNLVASWPEFVRDRAEYRTAHFGLAITDEQLEAIAGAVDVEFAEQAEAIADAARQRRALADRVAELEVALARIEWWVRHGAACWRGVDAGAVALDALNEILPVLTGALVHPSFSAPEAGGVSTPLAAAPRESGRVAEMSVTAGEADAG